MHVDIVKKTSDSCQMSLNEVLCEYVGVTVGVILLGIECRIWDVCFNLELSK